MRRDARLVFAGALLAAATLIVGCGSSGEGGETTSGGTTATAQAEQAAPKVALLMHTLNDYYTPFEEHLKAKVGPAGGSVTVFNANFDPQKQAQQCQDAVTSGRYTIVVIAPVSGPSAVPCVRTAKAAGVPVVSVDYAVGKDPEAVDPTVDGVDMALNLPPSTAAERTAELARDACATHDPCNIIVEVATPNDPYTNGVADAVAKVPRAKVVATVVGQYDPSLIAKAFPDALSAHPDANVFVSAADSQALAVLPALKSAGKLGDVALIGNGGSRAGVQAIKDGTMYGTLPQWPAMEGDLIGENVIKLVNGETVSPVGVNGFDISTPSIVTQDNVDEFTPEWGKTAS